MIRTEVIPSDEIYQGDYRLDGAFYCSVGAKIARLLVSSRMRLDALEKLCVPDGLYIPPRFKRPYVSDPAYGIPYMTGSAIALADPLQFCAYLSRNPRLVPHRERLMLQPGMIIVTSSGETGLAVYVNALFNGTIGSPDLLRVVPDTRRIPPGYLYAFLASQIGRELLMRGTYGAVIPHIESSHVVDLPVPRFDAETELAIHALIEETAAKRVEASWTLSEADRVVHEIAGLPREFSVSHDHDFAIGTVQDREVDWGALRLDAYHYIGYAGEVRNWRSAACPMQPLSRVTSRIFEPPIFKRVRAEEGVPYLLGAEVYLAHPRASTNIARGTPNLSEYLLRREMIVFEDAGQRYGLLGTPAYIGRTLNDYAATNNMVRLVCQTRRDSGFLFALLRSNFGVRLIRRLSYGTSLPHILPKQVEAIEIPWPSEDQRTTVADLVLRAVDLRDEANDLEDEAQAQLKTALEAACRISWPELTR